MREHVSPMLNRRQSEIDQEPNVEAGRTQIVDDLRRLGQADANLCLQFDQDLAVADEVSAVPCGQHPAFKADVEGDLAPEWNAIELELDGASW